MCFHSFDLDAEPLSTPHLQRRKLGVPLLQVLRQLLGGGAAGPQPMCAWLLCGRAATQWQELQVARAAGAPRPQLLLRALLQRA